MQLHRYQPPNTYIYPLIDKNMHIHNTNILIAISTTVHHVDCTKKKGGESQHWNSLSLNNEKDILPVQLCHTKPDHWDATKRLESGPWSNASGSLWSWLVFPTWTRIVKHWTSFISTFADFTTQLIPVCRVKPLSNSPIWLNQTVRRLW